MKKYDFPLLKPEQIEARVGQVSKNGCSLLLYKTSRTDAEILDQVVGQGNWQKKFYTLEGVGIGDKVRSIVVCSVGIFDEEKNQWIWKDDSGSEGDIEADKSVCSDAFKRASGGSCWGIGRELYYTGFIFVKCETVQDTKGYKLVNPFVKYEVKEIEWNKTNTLTLKKLVIVNDNGEVVFEHGKKQSFENKPGQKIAPNDTRTYQAKVYDYFNTLPTERQEKFLQNVISNEFGVGRIDDLTDEQARQVFVKYCNRG